VTAAFGQQNLNSGNTEFNALSFVIQQALAKINVATLVKVIAVYGGGTAVVGTVDVLPLVQQVAGDGTVVPHTTIYGVPYMRVQGGANAVIIDPVVGDIGFCVFADRDINSAQDTCAPAPPSSERRFDMSDGLYIGGWCGNLAPSQYMQFLAGSILLQTTAVNTPTAYQVGGVQVLKSPVAVSTPSAHTYVSGTQNINASDATALNALQTSVIAIVNALKAHGMLS